MIDRLHVHISGLVQGVGFRHATYLQACELNLAGWVRNVPDGRVEAFFEGPKATLERMLEWCRRGPYLARVAKVDAEWSAEPAGFTEFEIRF